MRPPIGISLKVQGVNGRHYSRLRGRCDGHTVRERTGRPVTFKNLDYVVRDRIAEIALTRVPVNAIDHGPIEDLNTAYRQAKADPGMRAVILTSAFTRAFSAGTAFEVAVLRQAGLRGRGRVHGPGQQDREGGADDGRDAFAKDFAAKSPLVMALARNAVMRASDLECRLLVTAPVQLGFGSLHTV